MDDCAILLIFSTIILDFFNVGGRIQRPLFAVATLIMWLKAIYYLRIFRNVGYLTSLIMQVIVDIRYFIVILMMSIFAFGNAFYMLSMNNTPNQ